MLIVVYCRYFYILIIQNDFCSQQVEFPFICSIVTTWKRLGTGIAVCAMERIVFMESTISVAFQLDIQSSCQTVSALYSRKLKIFKTLRNRLRISLFP